MKYGVYNEISSFERELEEQGIEQDAYDEESVEKRVQELEDFYDASDESFLDSEIESENDEKIEPRLRTRNGLEIPFKWNEKTSKQKKEANKRRRRQKIVEKKNETQTETKNNETTNVSKKFPVINWENAEELTENWGKKNFLSKVNAADCIKDIISGCYLMQLQATIAAKALMRQKKVKPLIKKLTKMEKKACEDFASNLRETELEEWVT